MTKRGNAELAPGDSKSDNTSVSAASTALPSTISMLGGTRQLPPGLGSAEKTTASSTPSPLTSMCTTSLQGKHPEATDARSCSSGRPDGVAATASSSPPWTRMPRASATPAGVGPDVQGPPSIVLEPRSLSSRVMPSLPHTTACNA